jgi:hypothetical protein
MYFKKESMKETTLHDCKQTHQQKCKTVQSLFLGFYRTCWTKDSNNTDYEQYEILGCNISVVWYQFTSVWEEHSTPSLGLISKSTLKMDAVCSS